MSQYQLPSLHTKEPPPPGDKVIKTVAELIDFNADQNPDHVFCLQMTRQSPNNRLQPVSFSLLRGMIVTCQEWILDTVREAKQPFLDVHGVTMKCMPVAIFMDSNLDLLVHLFALVGLGIPVRSPWSHVPSHAHVP